MVTVAAFGPRYSSLRSRRTVTFRIFISRTASRRNAHRLARGSEKRELEIRPKGGQDQSGRTISRAHVDHGIREEPFRPEDRAG